MEQDEAVHPDVVSAVPGQREAASVRAESTESAEPSADAFGFASVANPNRLRLGVSSAR